MRFFLLLAVIFSVLFYFFGNGEKERVRTLASIAEAPGFARATADGLSRTKGKRGESLHVYFKYEVDGVSYRTSTTSTDENGARAYLLAPVTEVAYDKRKPSVATLRQYFDRRNKAETVGRAMFLAGIMSLLFALPIALGMAWPLGWLRRRPAE